MRKRNIRFLAVGLIIFIISSFAVAQVGPERITLDKGWSFRQLAKEDWLGATVPGCVHTDLLAQGKIDDPFYRDNEQKLQWIGKSDWEYKTNFEIAPEQLTKRVDLVFEGLDTYAEVFLNGKKILTADNMFRTWRVDLKPYLLQGKNRLQIKFASPINKILPTMKNIPFQLPASNDQGEKTSPYTRKAPYQFGWDWGPRFVTCGIWRPVYLEVWDNIRIADVHVKTNSLSVKEKNIAEIGIKVDIFAQEAGEYQIDYVFQESEGMVWMAEGDFRNSVQLKKGLNTIQRIMMIPSPKLWWPRGQGEQNLNGLTVELRKSEKLLDKKRTIFGIRTVELEQKRDDEGESFTFVINGRPIFAKGANWIPADIFPSRMTPDKYAQLLESCADANFNMLRVWGGGIYEDDEFYRLCDELGIMVWQDFMFACSMYPGDNAFLENVRAEAIDNIVRLRNHPSVVLWCGNNEIETAWFHWGWKKALPPTVWEDYLKLFHNVLPNAVALYDTGKPYWPSSPTSNLTADANAENIGDQHYWGVWHGEEKFEEYRNHTPRFSSEYGFQSFPMLKTVNSYTLPEDHDIDSPVMKAHQKHPRGNQLIRKYMDWYYPEAKDFASFLYLSQVQQAEGIKVAAEHLLSNMPWCMGSLYWQTNDCWPVASWSGIDYFGRWKALQFYAKKFYADLLLTLEMDEEKGLQAFLVKSGLPTWKGELKGEVILLDASGKTIAKSGLEIPAKLKDGKAAIKISELSNLPEIKEGQKSSHFYYAYAKDKEGSIVAEQYYFLTAMKDLKMAEPGIKHKILGKVEIDAETEVLISTEELHGSLSFNRYQRPDFAEEKFVEIVLSTDKPAFNIYLEFPGVDGQFSDNFFHLLPGIEKKITFIYKGEKVPAQLKVSSLIDAFK